jgi:hypothetical protein
MATTSALTAQQQAAAEANARISANNEFRFAVEEFNNQQAENQLNLGKLDIDKKTNAEDRATQRQDQYRQIASKYAARGIRGAVPVNELNRFDAQQNDQIVKEQNAIDFAKAQSDLRFGLGGQANIDSNIWNDPAKFGTVGASARRAALKRLQDQGINYSNGMGA